MASSGIPTVDLSPFFGDGDQVADKKKIMEVIGQACSEHGFFQIVNHGVPLGLMKQALELSKTFFDYSDEEKLKYSSPADGPLPAGYTKPLLPGYTKQPEQSPDNNEYLMMLPPGSAHSIYNVFPTNPPEFKEVLEGIFSHLTKTSRVIESIINECLGLPPNFLKEFNQDRSWDFMAALRYLPATETDQNNDGITEHEDANCITFVFQDEADGLEVLKDGEWIPITPSEGTLVVNVSDVIQVVSNNKFKSATHRVVRPKGKNRHSFAFFYNMHGEQWVEPLPQFTEEIGEAPKYKGFLLTEYLCSRIKNKTHPPSKPEDVCQIKKYAIST